METLKNGQWWNLCRNCLGAFILGFIFLISQNANASYEFPYKVYNSTYGISRASWDEMISYLKWQASFSYGEANPIITDFDSATGLRLVKRANGNLLFNMEIRCNYSNMPGTPTKSPAGVNTWRSDGLACINPSAPPTCPTGQAYDPSTMSCTQSCIAGTDQYTGTWAMSSTGGQACVNGCFYKTNQTVCGGPSGANQSCVGTVVTNTGSKCSTTENKDLPNSCSGVASAYCCLQQGKNYGMVNGTAVCTAPSSSNPVTKTSTKTETKTNSDGTKSVTETTISTTDKGDSGVTNSTGSKTTGYNASGTATGTTDNGTTTTDESKQDFCKENPNDETCKEKSSFSGSCGAFACEGDAIQCAIAEEQHKRNCKLFDEKTALSDLGNSLAAGTDPNAADSPFAEANKSKFNFGGTDGQIDQSSLWGGQCIPPQSFSVFGRSYTIDTTKLCETIALFGNLFVAVSLLGAVRIIGTGA